MAQLTDYQRFCLTDKIYEDRVLYAKNPLTDKLEQEDIITLADKSKWVSVSAVNSTSNGLQAVAFVSVTDYLAKQENNLSPNRLVFVSRGSTEPLDWYANIRELGLGIVPHVRQKLSLRKEATLIKDYQFIAYEKFVTETVEFYQPETYEFVGHSLGGALAQYLAVIKNKSATTFAAAKAYRLLPRKYKEYVATDYYNEMIIDYRQRLDPVGYLPRGKIIGTRILVPRGPFNIESKSHLGTSFKGLFTEEGQIRKIKSL